MVFDRLGFVVGAGANLLAALGLPEHRAQNARAGFGLLAGQSIDQSRTGRQAQSMWWVWCGASALNQKEKGQAHGHGTDSSTTQQGEHHSQRGKRGEQRTTCSGGALFVVFVSGEGAR